MRAPPARARVTARRLIDGLRRRVQRLADPGADTERLRDELRTGFERLADAIEQAAAAARGARHAAEQAEGHGRLLTQAVRGALEGVTRTLDDHRARTTADLETVRHQLDDRYRALVAHAHALQLNQLELSRTGPITFRAATSTQLTMPLWRLADGALRFVRDAGPLPRRAAVISLPKSGTYLMAEILGALGYVNTHIQAWAHGLHDYRDLSIQAMITDYLAHYVAIPIAVSAPLVGPGQFWVGHFEAALCRDALADFRKVFMIRDVRYALVSYMRWLCNPGRGGAAADAWRALPDSEEKLLAFFETHGRIYLAWCRDIVGWLEADDVCVVRFEDVAGLRGAPAQAAATAALARHLDEADATVAAAIRQSVGRQTKTFSGRYSSLDGMWSARIDERFAEASGHDLNARLGYGPDPSRAP